MGSAYQILGRSFQPHQLAIGTLSLVALVAMPNPLLLRRPRKWKFKLLQRKKRNSLRNTWKNTSNCAHQIRTIYMATWLYSMVRYFFIFDSMPIPCIYSKQNKGWFKW
ncbi:ATP synthase subunit K [Nakaseomyces glabratus]